MSKCWTVALLLLVAAIAGINYGASADEKAQSLPSFQEKVILLELRSEKANDHGPFALADAEAKTIGDDVFVVGTQVAGMPWGKNKRVWLPLEDVRYIAEYKSVDELRGLIRLDD